MTTEGWDVPLSAPRLRLALQREDLDAVARIFQLLDATDEAVLPIVGVSAYLALRLDALVALGEHGRLDEELARPELKAALMEPFVLRALGQARSQRGLVEQAASRFDALGLDWHAAQTRELL